MDIKIKIKANSIYKRLQIWNGIFDLTNKELEVLGVKQGDKISFTPDSEYEFTVDDEKLYRMYDHQITMKL